MLTLRKWLCYKTFVTWYVATDLIVAKITDDFDFSRCSINLFAVVAEWALSLLFVYQSWKLTPWWSWMIWCEQVISEEKLLHYYGRLTLGVKLSVFWRIVCFFQPTGNCSLIENLKINKGFAGTVTILRQLCTPRLKRFHISLSKAYRKWNLYIPM